MASMKKNGLKSLHIMSSAKVFATQEGRPAEHDWLQKSIRYPYRSKSVCNTCTWNEHIYQHKKIQTSWKMEFCPDRLLIWEPSFSSGIGAKRGVLKNVMSSYKNRHNHRHQLIMQEAQMHTDDTAHCQGTGWLTAYWDSASQRRVKNQNYFAQNNPLL